MASADLSRRVEKVVGYPPLVDMDDRQRREFHEALLDADSFEDLVGTLQRSGEVHRGAVTAGAPDSSTGPSERSESSGNVFGTSRPWWANTSLANGVLQGAPFASPG
jgi:hypothetical protein